MSEVMRVLNEMDTDPSAAEQLLPLVYAELRQLAAARMSRESADHSLDATALVHEAYIRLVDQDRSQHWNSRGHFFFAAAEAMRRILVESARRKKSLKAGGEFARTDFTAGLRDDDRGPNIDLMDIDDALTELAENQPEKAELVKLRFFAGLSVEEAAAAMGISRSTAKRYWTSARAWLYGRCQP